MFQWDLQNYIKTFVSLFFFFLKILNKSKCEKKKKSVPIYYIGVTFLKIKRLPACLKSKRNNLVDIKSFVFEKRNCWGGGEYRELDFFFLEQSQEFKWTFFEAIWKLPKEKMWSSFFSHPLWMVSGWGLIGQGLGGQWREGWMLCP